MVGPTPETGSFLGLIYFKLFLLKSIEVLFIIEFFSLEFLDKFKNINKSKILLIFLQLSFITMCMYYQHNTI
jgi:hypothetical protein